jgi:hypothetical protein
LAAIPAAFAADPADTFPIPAASDVTALKDYTYDQRSDFTVTVRSVAAKFDTLIVRLAKREKGGIEGGANAIALEKLQSSRTELDHEIAKLEDVTPETWVAVRDAVLKALEQTRTACADAAKK